MFFRFSEKYPFEFSESVITNTTNQGKTAPHQYMLLPFVYGQSRNLGNFAITAKIIGHFTPGIIYRFLEKVGFLNFKLNNSRLNFCWIYSFALTWKLYSSPFAIPTILNYSSVPLGRNNRITCECNNGRSISSLFNREGVILNFSKIKLVSTTG